MGGLLLNLGVIAFVFITAVSFAWLMKKIEKAK